MSPVSLLPGTPDRIASRGTGDAAVAFVRQRLYGDVEVKALQRQAQDLLDQRYRAGFALECRAMRKVRDTMGLENVKLMVPFCRTIEEGRRVIAEMATHGLIQGERGLEVRLLPEEPPNLQEHERSLLAPPIPGAYWLRKPAENE